MAPILETAFEPDSRAATSCVSRCAGASRDSPEKLGKTLRYLHWSPSWSGTARGPSLRHAVDSVITQSPLATP